MARTRLGGFLRNLVTGHPVRAVESLVRAPEPTSRRPPPVPPVPPGPDYFPPSPGEEEERRYSPNRDLFLVPREERYLPTGSSRYRERVQWEPSSEVTPSVWRQIQREMDRLLKDGATFNKDIAITDDTEALTPREREEYWSTVSKEEKYRAIINALEGHNQAGHVFPAASPEEILNHLKFQSRAARDWAQQDTGTGRAFYESRNTDWDPEIGFYHFGF